MMPSLTPSLVQLAERIFDEKIIDLAGYHRHKIHEREPSRPLAPIKFNFRTDNHPTNPGPLTRATLEEIGRELYNLAAHRGLTLTCEIAGIPHAGEALAAAYAAQVLGTRIVHHFQKTETEAGRKIERIIGSHGSNRGLLLIDDVFCDGRTKIEAIQAANQSSYLVRDILVVVDYEKPAAHALLDTEPVASRVTSLFTLSWLLDFYRQTGRISPEKLAEVQAYLKL